TGNILSEVSIQNKGVNLAFLSPSFQASLPQVGGQSPPSKEQPVSIPLSSSTSSTQSGGGGGTESGGVGGGAGAVFGAILPATGANSMFILTLISFIMFLSGCYLRFRSDISPPAFLFA